MKLKEHREAERLRKRGFSVKELAYLLSVSQSTISEWVRDIPLSASAMQRLRLRVSSGQLKSAERRKQRTEKLNAKIRAEARAVVANKASFYPAEAVICALLFWCEGNKKTSDGIAFTNSDPTLVRAFADLLIRNFNADRSKFRPRLHLHEYHDEAAQIRFWSRAINIPASQFRKTFWKPHSGIRQRENYPGCISLRFHDTILARKLAFIAQEYLTGASFNG